MPRRLEKQILFFFGFICTYLCTSFARLHTKNRSNKVLRIKMCICLIFLHKATEILWASQSSEISTSVWQIPEVWIIKLWDNSHRYIFHLFDIFYMLHYFHVMFPTVLVWWNIENSLSNSFLTKASTATPYICWGWSWESALAQYRNIRCHFWTLRPKTLKTYALPAGNSSTVVCVANKPWKSPDPIHQVFTSTYTENASVAFSDSNTR